MQFSPLPGIVLFDYAHWSFAKATNNLVHHRKSLGRRKVKNLQQAPAITTSSKVKREKDDGPLVEAKVEGKKITLAPKVVVNRKFIERCAISRQISACESFPGGGCRTSTSGHY